MDDGIGIYLVEDLKRHMKNPNIEFIVGETDIDYCLSKISRGNNVVVIDAYLSDILPGEVSIINLRDLKKGDNVRYSLHGMHFLDIIQGIKNEPGGILIGIEPYEINYGFSLSPELKKCYPIIYEQVYRYVNNYIELCGGMKMHDTFLLKRISDNLIILCNTNKITKVRKLHIITSPNSHINEESLYEHLKEQNAELIGEWTNIIVERQDIENLTAVIESVEGDVFDK